MPPTWARRGANFGSSLGSIFRPRLTSASPSNISMTIPGLPSSSPVGSNQSGAGIGILPVRCSVDSTSHSVARSVSMIASPGGGSWRTM